MYLRKRSSVTQRGTIGTICGPEVFGTGMLFKGDLGLCIHGISPGRYYCAKSPPPPPGPLRLLSMKCIFPPPSSQSFSRKIMYACTYTNTCTHTHVYVHTCTHIQRYKKMRPWILLSFSSEMISGARLPTNGCKKTWLSLTVRS